MFLFCSPCTTFLLCSLPSSFCLNDKYPQTCFGFFVSFLKVSKLQKCSILLIPLTLSFISSKSPRGVCSNYTRPWSDWACTTTTTTANSPLKCQHGFFWVSSVSCVLTKLTLVPVYLCLLCFWILSPGSFPPLPRTNMHTRVQHCPLSQKEKSPTALDTFWRYVIYSSKPVWECVKDSLASNYQQLPKVWNRYRNFYSVRAVCPLFTCTLTFQLEAAFGSSWRWNWNTVWLVGNKVFEKVQAVSLIRSVLW